MLRKTLFWIHLTAGALAGLVILVMSVTGALLAMQPQVLRFVERKARIVTPPASPADRLAPEALLARALSARPDLRPASLTLDADPRVAAAVGVGREGALYLDPYTGAVTGEGSKSWRGFFHAVTDWHRFLGTHDDARPIGKAVTGASNAAFLFLSMSGVYLWWPRQWTRRHLRAVALFQGGLRGKARDFNWHNVIGLWCAAVIFFLTLTALVLSYPALGNALHATGPPGGAPPGGASPATRGPARAEVRSERPEPPLTPASFAGFDGAWAAARDRAPGWTLGVLRVPRPGAPVSVAVTDSPSRSPYGRSQLTYDARKGEVSKWEPFAGFAPGRKTRTAARWLHTGELLSWPGQVVAGLASLGGAFLAWTGVSLALRRFAAWRAASGARRDAKAPASAEPA